MTLGEWLAANRETDAAFARRSGVAHKQLVGKYRRGLQIPSPLNMARIVAATGGQVTPNDFYQHAVASSAQPSGCAA
ncbi:XRE family transcriptional regulator [Pseudoroseomonas cervicalis]|uniref:XRE family transcriptional regulator n=1 Tax=Teichococcus cervicalis TaxID=204525 RepID=UPI0027D7BB20|nr:XRE family transcriptional regulator [Pseudoroseomonas cervicalis]